MASQNEEFIKAKNLHQALYENTTQKSKITKLF